MVKVLMYSTHACPYCRLAERLFTKKGVTVEYVHVDETPERREEMTQLTGRTSVPQIFIGGAHIGGYNELAQLDLRGKLDALLRGESSSTGETNGRTS